jgi:chromosome condensin MukBEF ATPase and DNA-binding subunit MukB
MKEEIKTECDSLRRQLRDTEDTLDVVRKASIERGQEADSLRRQLALVVEHVVANADLADVVADFKAKRDTAQQRIAKLENDLMATQILAGANDRRAIKNAAALRAIAPVWQAAEMKTSGRHHIASKANLDAAVSTARARLTPELLAVIESACTEPT